MYKYEYASSKYINRISDDSFRGVTNTTTTTVNIRITIFKITATPCS